MFKAVSSPYLVPFDGKFSVQKASTLAKKRPADKECRKRLKKQVSAIDKRQRVLYASDKQAVLLVFQAMDAAGKDSTIRAVLTGVNPAAFQVHSFKRPSAEELDHDFLWRTSYRLPERGRIGIFNRSYYEEVLVVRVHPEYLKYQRLPEALTGKDIWKQRYESIRDDEKHLARNGYVIVKFWLNVSRDEQRNRFLSRLDEPRKNWKFSADDLKERDLWDNYMAAYEEVLKATSRPWAPWYAIPADNKPYMRMVVGDIVARTLKSLDLQYPRLDKESLSQFGKWREELKRQ